MNLDEQVRTALRTESAIPQTPRLDVAALVRGGRVRRRNRRLRGAAAALAAAAVGVVALGHVPGTGRDTTPADRPSLHPAPLVQDLPTGPVPAIPYCTNGALHGNQAVPCLPMIHSGGTTVQYSDSGVWLLDGNRRLLLDRRPPARWVPAVSHDGSYVAWVVPSTGTTGTLLAFDRTGTKVAEVHLPTSDTWVPGIDDRGRVYVDGRTIGPPATQGPPAGARALWMYDIPAHKLVDVSGNVTGQAIRYVTADGLGIDGATITRSRLLPTSVVGRVDDAGHWVAARTVNVGWAAWSPDRSLVVEETGDGSWAVLGPDASRPERKLALPSPGRPIALPVWESGDTVLLSFDPAATGLMAADASNGFDTPAAQTYVLRCSVSSGACEIALRPGYADNMNGPLYR